MSIVEDAVEASGSNTLEASFAMLSKSDVAFAIFVLSWEKIPMLSPCEMEGASVAALTCAICVEEEVSSGRKLEDC